MVKKYRKKPVVVEVYKVSDLLQAAEHDWVSLPEDIKEIYEKGNFLFAAQQIFVNTSEGKMVAELDDYIIKEPFPTDDRKFYPCKPDIFEKTYEEVK